MKEYKAKYPHAQAKELLNRIGAIFTGKKEQSDFYLKTKNSNIFKLQKEDGSMYLVNLTLEDGGFVLNISEYLSEEVRDVLSPLFQNNPLVLKKSRECYSWKGSEISLDRVEKFGEFIEFYPVSEEAKTELLETFGVKESDFVTKSYFDL